jgi:hypothetical protein
MSRAPEILKVMGLALGLPSLVLGLFFGLYSLVEAKLISWTIALALIVIVIFNALILMVKYGMAKKNKP